MALTCCGAECVQDDCVQLTERESSVCKLICGSTEPITFGRLKEATSLHQEVVSRIVRRLILHGLVTKTDHGYSGECGR
jgi:predicted transcriptional regulator